MSNAAFGCRTELLLGFKTITVDAPTTVACVLTPNYIHRLLALPIKRNCETDPGERRFWLGAVVDDRYLGTNVFNFSKTDNVGDEVRTLRIMFVGQDPGYVFASLRQRSVDAVPMEFKYPIAKYWYLFYVSPPTTSQFPFTTFLQF